MKYIPKCLEVSLVLCVLSMIAIGQAAVDTQVKNALPLRYQGCWAGADRSVTHLLIKKNTIQDTRSRRIFHYVETARDPITNTVALKLVDEVPSRRRFVIVFVADNEILVGMPMFRDKCTKLPPAR